ncbi:MAG: alpha/beta hydrolase [Pseudorhodobacter sp.]|nr:alpha/beta hydrolase [Pseudorhodobacter sp.]
MTQFFNTPDGARLAFRDEGQGTPLLCLAGLTRTMGDFDYLAPHLPPCRLIRMDYRGRGASQWTGAASYTVPQEARDALALLDHLGVAQVAVLGSSRGGMIGMVLAARARERLLGLCFNDVGPALQRAGLERIFAYVGRNPSAKTFEALAATLPASLPGFQGVSPERWLAEARLHYTAADGGLKITYDPALREAFLAATEGPAPDLWPLFDVCAGLPLALIRAANSDLLSVADAAEMRRRRPDMIFGLVPDRAHIPFLDEPEALAVITAFLKAVQ